MHYNRAASFPAVFPDTVDDQRIVVIQETNDHVIAHYVDLPRRAVEHVVAVVLPAAVPYLVCMRNAVNSPEEMQAISHPFTARQVKLPTQEYEAIIGYTSASFAAVLPK